MHDVLRQRLLRRIESLPDDQIYQVLDYIEFLESKYAPQRAVEASGLQKFAEGLEDQLRRRAVSPSTLREAFQLLSSADRILSDVARTGRELLDDLSGPTSGGAGSGGPTSKDPGAGQPSPRRPDSRVPDHDRAPASRPDRGVSGSNP
jgi:hypothetical protein